VIPPDETDRPALIILLMLMLKNMCIITQHWYYVVVTDTTEACQQGQNRDVILGRERTRAGVKMTVFTCVV